MKKKQPEIVLDGRPSAAPALLLFVAFRLLLKRRRSFAVLVVAVAVGVGFQIPNFANLNGYTQTLLDNGVLRANGHLVLSAGSKDRLNDVNRTRRAVERYPEVAATVVRRTHAGVLFSGKTIYPSRIQGITVEEETRANGFCNRLASGTCHLDDKSVILGHALAEKLGVKSDGRVKFTIPYQDLGDVAYASKYYGIAGIVSGGGQFAEDSDVFVSRQFLLEILGEKDSADVVLVYLKDPDFEDAVISEVKKDFPQIAAAPWWKINRFVASAIEGNHTLSLISMMMVLTAVMIPVLALLYIHAIGETEHIGILGALGFRPLEIFEMFFLKAVIVAVVGAILGIGVGIGLCSYFDAHPIFSNNGFEVKPILSGTTILVPSAVIFIATVIAGIFPALYAARKNPATVLK